jgi:hypothetical protein
MRNQKTRITHDACASSIPVFIIVSHIQMDSVPALSVYGALSLTLILSGLYAMRKKKFEEIG